MRQRTLYLPRLPDAIMRIRMGRSIRRNDGLYHLHCVDDLSLGEILPYSPLYHSCNQCTYMYFTSVVYYQLGTT